MSYTINDKTLINDIRNSFSNYIGKTLNDFNNNVSFTGQMQEVYINTLKKISNDNEDKFKDSYKRLEYPLDSEIINLLLNIIGGHDEFPYSKAKELDKLWAMLIEKSINCLRFFDTREPFMLDSNKKIYAYGIEELKKYHERYTKFENILYGASEYYRDHIFHAIRTWLIGIFCLLKKIDNESLFIDEIQIDGVNDDNFAKDINFFEKLSIWTISSLCHDLGYPLEKSQQILEKTKDMMKEFIPNPIILNNFSFSGIQDNINEYIVKFMSTKMKKQAPKDKNFQENSDKYIYYGRIQPKYYLKYTKSLEKNQHGIISAVIIYKMLLYFIESDFNLNDDYEYTFEDARQFYIRREILRSMSSHTCSDIYNTKITTMSSLLFLCDEMQEWGRKSWNDLYTSIKQNATTLTINKFNSKLIDFEEKIDMDNVQDNDLIINNIVRLYKRQYKNYQLIFRDGQYTNTRAFNINKKTVIEAAPNGTDSNKIEISYKILAKGENIFLINLKDSSIEKNILEDAFKKELKLDNLPEVIKFDK